MTADLVVTDIAATNDPDDLRGIADRAFELFLREEARNQRALDLHTPIDTEFGERCTGCGHICPCPTRRELEGEQ